MDYVKRPEKPNLSEKPIRIRKATEADIGFIFSSWLKSYRDSDFGANITTTVYFSEHHKILERLMKSCEVYIACNEKDVAEIYGFICAEKIDGIFVLHYAYVKHTFRRLGIATLLLNVFDHTPGAAAIYTHHTKIAARLAAKYHMIHSPYIALTPDYRAEVVAAKEPQDDSSK